jgi:biopolymer transport protein ExbD
MANAVSCDPQARRVQFERRAERRRGPGLTPLIDVVFLLLIFFMLATRFDRESVLPLAVHVAAPGARTPESRDAPKALRVDIAEDGRLRIDGRDGEDLFAAVRAAAREERPVRLRPDPETPLQPIVDVLAAAQHAGVRAITIEKPDGPES